MALIKVFTVEVYDDPQLAIKDGTTRGYFTGVEGLIANLEASINEYCEAKGINLSSEINPDDIEEVDE